MLQDIDLCIESNDADDASTTGPQHKGPPQSQPPLHPPPTRRRSYLGYIAKRPRRNVVKRSIATLKHDQLAETEESEKQTLLGFDLSRDNEYESAWKNRYRAPRLASALFLLVLVIGSYQNKPMLSRQTSNNDEQKPKSGTEESYEFLSDVSATASEIDEDAELVSSVENTPVLLFNEEVTVPTQLFNFVNVNLEPFNPQQHKLFWWNIPRTGGR